MHDGIRPAMKVGSFAAIGEHGIAMVQRRRIAQTVGESLHENAINAVILHPLEMFQHSRFLKGTEYFSRFSICHFETGGEALAGVQFGNVRPQIHLGITILKWTMIFSPMPPALFRTSIARSAKPPLITAHDLTK